jgi:hypothetical protein
MSQKNEDISEDADWLSLDYLITECICNPAVRNRHLVKLNRCATI